VRGRSVIMDGPDSWSKQLVEEGVIEKFVPIDFSDDDKVFDNVLEAIEKVEREIGELDGVSFPPRPGPEWVVLDAGVLCEAMRAWASGWVQGVTARQTWNSLFPAALSAQLRQRVGENLTGIHCSCSPRKRAGRGCACARCAGAASIAEMRTLRMGSQGTKRPILHAKQG
jgi:hypothetical protein